MTTQIASQSYSLQSLHHVSELIRQRDISPVDLVTACLSRIERIQPELNAFITVTAEAALQAATIAETEIQHGRWKGPLHGIPVGIKDFYDTAGIRTTAAFEHFRNRVPRKDAVGVAKLKKAGAIIIGKMNMHTLGMGTTGLVSCFESVQNPWNGDYIPGGSSSGSAAAVASGLCYATLDTDAIGSCRLPAACCGVVGYKGTFGLIDMTGILEGEQPPDDNIRWMSHAGITTRSIQDTALVLDVLAERKADIKTATFSDILAKERALRIGVADNFKADVDVSKAFEEAVVTIRSFGHAIKNVSAPLTDFSKGIVNIEEDRRAVGHLVFKDIDVLLLPTASTTTLLVKNAEQNPVALSPEHTMFANYCGLPAVSVPSGFDRHGLPLGLQLVAKPGDDGAILRLAHLYETATEYATKHPIP